MFLLHRNPRARRLRLVSFLAAGAALMASGSGWAAGCSDNWRGDIVCRVDLRQGTPGQGNSRPWPQGTMNLEPGRSVDMLIHTFNQKGHGFDLQRLYYGVDMGRGCEDTLSFERVSSVQFRFTGRRSGTCDMMIWLPGNKNFDRRVLFNVGGGGGGGAPVSEAAPPVTQQPSGSQADRRAETVVRRLYDAVYLRQPSAGELQQGMDDVRRRRSSALVGSMVQSQEFRERAQRAKTMEILNNLYWGLLSRRPDNKSRDHYKDLDRGRYQQVIQSLIGSQEFAGVVARDAER